MTAVPVLDREGKPSGEYTYQGNVANKALELIETVRRELAPYATPSNTDIGGPDVTLRAEAGQAMAWCRMSLLPRCKVRCALDEEWPRVDPLGPIAERLPLASCSRPIAYQF